MLYRFLLSCVVTGSLMCALPAMASDCPPSSGMEQFLTADRISEFTVVSGDLHISSQYRIPQTRFGRFIWYNFRRERVRLQTWQGHLTGNVMTADGQMQPFDQTISFNLICDDHGSCDTDLEVRRKHVSGQIMFLQRGENGRFEVNISTCAVPTYPASNDAVSRVQHCLSAGGC